MTPPFLNIEFKVDDGHRIMISPFFNSCIHHKLVIGQLMVKEVMTIFIEAVVVVAFLGLVSIVFVNTLLIVTPHVSHGA